MAVTAYGSRKVEGERWPVRRVLAFVAGVLGILAGLALLAAVLIGFDMLGTQLGTTGVVTDEGTFVPGGILAGTVGAAGIANLALGLLVLWSSRRMGVEPRTHGGLLILWGLVGLLIGFGFFLGSVLAIVAGVLSLGIASAPAVRGAVEGAKEKVHETREDLAQRREEAREHARVQAEQRAAARSVEGVQRMEGAGVPGHPTVTPPAATLAPSPAAAAPLETSTVAPTVGERPEATMEHAADEARLARARGRQAVARWVTGAAGQVEQRASRGAAEAKTATGARTTGALAKGAEGLREAAEREESRAGREVSERELGRRP